MRDGKAYCYRFRFDDGEVFYIGNTINLYQRMKQHRDNWRVKEPFTVDVMEVSFAERYRIESALIRRYRPSENYFVAKRDNEYRNMAERWTPYARAFPDRDYRIGEVTVINDIFERGNGK